MGAIKQLADVVLGLFREEVYHPVPGSEGAAELAILKNRHGPTTYIDLYFYKQWHRNKNKNKPDHKHRAPFNDLVGGVYSNSPSTDYADGRSQ